MFESPQCARRSPRAPSPLAPPIAEETLLGGHIGWKGRDGLRAVRLFFFRLAEGKMGRDRARPSLRLSRFTGENIPLLLRKDEKGPALAGSPETLVPPSPN
jgi:hypothetical protein